ncbi:hypothetical protein ABIF65_002557 [Bradyrhizobium japonicum]
MRTLVRLPISQAAFAEIAAKLRAADYGHCFLTTGEIAMDGIAVDPIRTPSCRRASSRLIRGTSAATASAKSMDSTTWGTTTVKLANFNAVAELIKERDYLQGLLVRIGAELKITLKSPMLSTQDVRPDLVARMLPEMKAIIDQGIAVVDEKLAVLGVYSDKEAA